MLSEIFAKWRTQTWLSGWYARRYSKKTELFPDHLIAAYGLVVWGLKIGIFIFPLIYLLQPSQAQTMTNQCWQGLGTGFQMSVCFWSPINIGHWTLVRSVGQLWQTSRNIKYKAFLPCTDQNYTKRRISEKKFSEFWLERFRVVITLTVVVPHTSLLVIGICRNLLFPTKYIQRWLCWL